MIHNHLDIPQVYFHSEQGDPEGRINSALSTIDRNPLSYGVTNSTRANSIILAGQLIMIDSSQILRFFTFQMSVVKLPMMYCIVLF